MATQVVREGRAYERVKIWLERARDGTFRLGSESGLVAVLDALGGVSQYSAREVERFKRSRDNVLRIAE